jgi:ATP-dependent DNA ligase
MRVIASKRDPATGINFHHCPKRQNTGNTDGCEPCEFKDKIEHLQATYRVHCRFETEEVKGFIPSHAEDGGKDVLKRHEWNILEPKLDGARCILVVDEYGAVHAFTRNVDRFGKQKEISANLPHLQTLYLPDHANSTLDSEIIVQVCGDAVGTLGATMSVVGASPDTAIETQEKFGYAHFFVFDLPRLFGHDLTDQPWHVRHARKLAALAEIRADGDMAVKHLHLMPTYETHSPEERDGLFRMFLAQGAMIDGMVIPTEGVVVKHPGLTYFGTNAILKCKEFISLDVLVTGWEPGKKGGKWEHSIGALLFSVLTTDHELVEVGKVIPGDDAKRAEMYALLNGKTSNEIANLGIVLEIEGQNWTKECRIRHPRIARYRPDLAEPNMVDLSKVERK